MRYRVIIWALAAASLFSFADAYAQETDSMLPSDKRIRFLPYDENDVYLITTQYGFQTNIVFSPFEEIQTISVGDRSLWQLIPAGNRLFIRPMEEGVFTNMTVLTTKRSYQFDLKSAAPGKEGEALYVARFVYPDDMAAMMRNMPKPPEPSEPPPAAVPAPPPAPAPTPAPAPQAKSPPPSTVISQIEAPRPVTTTHDHAVTPTQMPGAGRVNYNYTYTGSDTLAPTQVYDDGVSTFIAYNKQPSPLPIMLARDESGKQREVHYYLKDSKLVVDTVLGEFVLKHPSGSVTVYNEVLNPAVTAKR